MYTSMSHAFRRIAAEEGPIAFFAGLSASILGLTHIMIQFPLYERIKADLSEYERRRGALFSLQSPAERDAPAATSTHVPTGQGRGDGGGGGGGGRGGSSLHDEADGGGASRSAPTGSHSMTSVVTASAVSKFIASTITYPHEVIRARLQYDQGGKLYTGLLDATIKTFRDEGLGGFWLGFRLNIVRTVPQAVVTFTMYEQLSRFLQRRVFKVHDDELDQARGRRRHLSEKPCADGERSEAIGVLTRTRSESRG